MINTQSEDVVADIHMTRDITQLMEEMPGVYWELLDIAERLEAHYCEMQDVEFKIENGKLWMLKAREDKRTGKASIEVVAQDARLSEAPRLIDPPALSCRGPVSTIRLNNKYKF